MYPFLKDQIITDLGFGSGFALWGFRAIATGQGNCRCLSSGFNRAFSLDNDTVKSQHGGSGGKLAINALKSFSYQLGNAGKRRIKLSSPGTMRITADEVCIIASLASAQGGNEMLCKAHLTWLLGGANTEFACHAAQTYGMICASAGITMDYFSPQENRKIASSRPSLSTHGVKVI